MSAHPLDRICEALRQIQSAADAYRGDPVNAYDRPSSWEKLDALLVEIDAARSALSEARRLRDAEPVAFGVLCTIRPDCHEPYDAFDQVELDPEAAAHAATIYTASANPRVVPLYALPLALEGAPTDSTEDGDG